jgi:hypothetical protein
MKTLDCQVSEACRRRFRIQIRSEHLQYSECLVSGAAGLGRRGPEVRFDPTDNLAIGSP